MTLGWSSRTDRVSFFLVLAVICIGISPAAAQTSHWIHFRDPKTGLSFRYPSDLRIRHRNPRYFNLPALKSVVELMGDTRVNPGTVVLRFLIQRGHLSPGARAEKLNQMRNYCKSVSPLLIDGHEAIVCVSAGSAAVRWSVKILRPRECTIVTLLGGAEADQAAPPPHDGEFPLLSIIRSVRFTAASKQSEH